MDDFSYKAMEGKSVTEGGKCKKFGSTIMFSILVFIIAGLTAFIVVTYVKELQCTSHASHGEAKPSNTVSFLMLSDIHLDLFYKNMAAQSGFCRNESVISKYKAKYGRIGCDSPINLYHNVLSAMKNQSMSQQKIDFILSTGDTAAHRLIADRRSIVLNIMRNSSEAVASVFPSLPYFSLIGNNDLPGHYIMPTQNDSWYSDLLDIWQDGILCTTCSSQTTTKDELKQTFLKGGYYKASIAEGKMTLLVLNSMYWTKQTWRTDTYFSEIAEEQMAWLEDQLNSARQLGKKVFITSHIAPGMDPYSRTGVYNSLWLKNFTDMYIEIVVNKFSDVIAGQFYAHFHKDSFRFLHDEKKDPTFQNSTFILLNPSVSVIYKNNPGFRVAHVDPEIGALIDYEQYYMSIVLATEFDYPVWQLDYKFSTRYPSQGTMDEVINGNRIKSLSDSLINQTNGDIFNGYISSRQVRYQPDPFSRFIYYCAVRFSKEDDFSKCQDKFKVPGG